MCLPLLWMGAQTSLEDLGRVALGHYLHLLTQRMPGIVAGLPASSFAEAPGETLQPRGTMRGESHPASTPYRQARLGLNGCCVILKYARSWTW